jgi:predicted metal-dependent HD superfamily phosphohydrolase
MNQELSQYVDHHVLDIVEHYILCTKAHKVVDSGDSNLKLFIDIDFQIKQTRTAVIRGI